jgi:hypothetical protein
MNLKTCALAALMMAAVPVTAFAAAKDTYAVLHASEPAIGAGMGRIYFYREDGLLGMAIQPTIMIDGVSAGGRSKPGDYFYVDRPAGAYKISTETEKEESTDISVVAGQAIYVKFEVSMGFLAGHVSPSVVDQQTAEKEIADCDWHAPQPPDAPPTASAVPAPATATAPAAASAPATTSTAPADTTSAPMAPAKTP